MRVDWIFLILITHLLKRWHAKNSQPQRKNKTKISFVRGSAHLALGLMPRRVPPYKTLAQKNPQIHLYIRT